MIQFLKLTRMRVCGVGDAFRAPFDLTQNPGFKPWAESYCPFGADDLLIAARDARACCTGRSNSNDYHHRHRRHL